MVQKVNQKKKQERKKKSPFSLDIWIGENNSKINFHELFVFLWKKIIRLLDDVEEQCECEILNGTKSCLNGMKIICLFLIFFSLISLINFLIQFIKI